MRRPLPTAHLQAARRLHDPPDPLHPVRRPTPRRPMEVGHDQPHRRRRTTGRPQGQPAPTDRGAGRPHHQRGLQRPRLGSPHLADHDRRSTPRRALRDPLAPRRPRQRAYSTSRRPSANAAERSGRKTPRPTRTAASPSTPTPSNSYANTKHAPSPEPKPSNSSSPTTPSSSPSPQTDPRT